MDIIWDGMPEGSNEQYPKRIVIHAMGEYIQRAGDKPVHAIEYLRWRGFSAHAFITSSGVVIRGRHDWQGAYHAKRFNTDSLGVEFLVPGIHTYGSFKKKIKENYLTGYQYQAGVEFVLEWVKKYEIDLIERHSDISPDRKVDPGKGFPWAQFMIDVLG